MSIGARIVVGIAGGIAAFKVAATVSKLVQAGHSVDVVLTENAHQFVGPATFAASVWTRAGDGYLRCSVSAWVRTSSWRNQADLLLIAPATARVLASCALGLSDDCAEHAVFVL